jgi:hypothetical protein
MPITPAKTGAKPVASAQAVTYRGQIPVRNRHSRHPIVRLKGNFLKKPVTGTIFPEIFQNKW